MDFLLNPNLWIALFTLLFLEIVLGIDNVIFISLTAAKVPEPQRRKLTNWGLVLAMVQRIIFLIFVSKLVSLSRTLFSLDLKLGSGLSIIKSDISVRSLVLFFGGLFLIYKSTSEIFTKVDKAEEGNEPQKQAKSTFASALIQIVLIDFVFSIDSVLTAVGMTHDLGTSADVATGLMVTAVILSILITMFFANYIREFISAHPSIQVLGLAFLLLIAFTLVAEAAHLSETIVLGHTVSEVPKGYLYFTIVFSLAVEFINIRKAKRHKP